MSLGMEVGLSPGDFVLDGDPAPKGSESHPILAHVYCGQTAAWIKMLRNIVFDVDPAIPQKKRHTNPTQFLAHVYCGQMAEWMKTPLGTEVYLGPGHIVLDGVPAPAKGAQQPPSFRPMSIVATVAHLSCCWARFKNVMKIGCRYWKSQRQSTFSFEKSATT